MDYQVLLKTEMNIPTSCVLAGHSPDLISWNLEHSSGATEMRKKLLAVLERLITGKGVVHFICGMTRGAAMLEAKCVLELKKRYPFITLQCVIPDRTYTNYWSADDRAAYRRITSKADSILAISDVPIRYGARMRREYMIDSAGYMLCIYRSETPGPVAGMIEYAVAHDRTVFMIDPDSFKLYLASPSSRSERILDKRAE